MYLLPAKILVRSIISGDLARGSNENDLFRRRHEDQGGARV